MAEFTEKKLADLRDRHEAWLKQQPGFQGSGIGLSQSGGVSLKVYTSRMSPAVRESIRQQLGDVPVDFEETGEIFPG